MIVRAEMRMADEIDRGQERGEVARAQDGTSIRDLVQGSDKVPATYEDLGLDRRRVAEWRETRDAKHSTRWLCSRRIAQPLGGRQLGGHVANMSQGANGGRSKPLEILGRRLQHAAT